MLKRRTGFRVYPACLLVLTGPQAWAAEWTTSAGVAPAIEYTDNVCLSSDNEKDEWIGLVTPDINVAGKGSRANVSLAASVELNTLSNNDLEDRGCSGQYGDREQFAPSLDATADAILVENWFYIDASATADQNDVTPYGSGGDDSLDRTGNTNTTYSYNVSPYIQRRFKDLADLTLRYTYDDQFNSKDLVGDSSEESAEFLLAGGPVFSPWSTSVQGDYSKVSYSDTPGRDTNEDSELKSAQFNLGYQLNRQWQVNGAYGNEWNDFVSSRDDIDGTFWDAGLRWTPNARTTVEAGTGDRFFGSTPRFSIDHRHKRSVFSASYVKDLTYDRNIRTLDTSLPGQPPAGGNATTLTNSPILDERFSLGYAYQGRRSGLGISASHSDQTREGGDLTTFDKSTFIDVSVSVNRSLSEVLSVSGGVTWDKQEPNGENSELFDSSETWGANLGVLRRLSQKMSLSFDYEYTDRQSDNQNEFGNLFGDYTENRFTLTLNVDL